MDGDALAAWQWLRRIERAVHLDDLVAQLALPRWRVLLALRSHPEAFAESAGLRWCATKLSPKT